MKADTLEEALRPGCKTPNQAPCLCFFTCFAPKSRILLFLQTAVRVTASSFGFYPGWPVGGTKAALSQIFVKPKVHFLKLVMTNVRSIILSEDNQQAWSALGLFIQEFFETLLGLSAESIKNPVNAQLFHSSCHFNGHKMCTYADNSAVGSTSWQRDSVAAHTPSTCTSVRSAACHRCPLRSE